MRLEKTAKVRENGEVFVQRQFHWIKGDTLEAYLVVECYDRCTTAVRLVIGDLSMGSRRARGDVATVTTTFFSLFFDLEYGGPLQYLHFASTTSLIINSIPKLFTPLVILACTFCLTDRWSFYIHLCPSRVLTINHRLVFCHPHIHA